MIRLLLLPNYSSRSNSLTYSNPASRINNNYLLPKKPNKTMHNFCKEKRKINTSTMTKRRTRRRKEIINKLLNHFICNSLLNLILNYLCSNSPQSWSLPYYRSKRKNNLLIIICQSCSKLHSSNHSYLNSSNSNNNPSQSAKLSDRDKTMPNF